MTVKTIIRFVVWIALSFTMMVSSGLARDMEIVENIKIVAIKSMEVEGSTLRLVTLVRNENKNKVRFTDSCYMFYLGANDEPGKPIGIDGRSKEIILEPTQSLSEDFNVVPFEIILGTTPHQVQNALTRIINVMGNPSEKIPVLYIDGLFRIGMLSDKGWSSLKGRVNWVFEADIKPQPLLVVSSSPPSFSVDDHTDFFQVNRCEIKRAWEDRGVVSLKSSAFFEYDSDVLLDQAKADLSAVVNFFANEEKDANMIIAGHTCDMGSPSYNMNLSYKRALSVKNYLISNGIGGHRIIVKCCGETFSKDNSNPDKNVPNKSEAQREQERRVDIMNPENPEIMTKLADINNKCKNTP